MSGLSEVDRKAIEEAARKTVAGWPDWTEEQLDDLARIAEDARAINHQRGLSEKDREHFRQLGAEQAEWTPRQLDDLARIAEGAEEKKGRPQPRPPRRGRLLRPEPAVPPGHLSSEGRTALYRHYDVAGELLYVGIAKDPDLRHRSHQSLSPWLEFAHHENRHVRWYASREEALEAERQAIQDEQPLFNKNYNPDRSRAVKYLADRGRLDLLGLGW